HSQGANRANVQKFLTDGTPHFISAFSANVTTHTSPLTLPSLRGLLTLLSWGNRFAITKGITVHLEADVIQKLFDVAMQSTESQASVAALMCLNETLEFSKWNPHNPHLLQLLLTISNSVVSLTTLYSSQLPPHSVDDDENGYSVQLCNLLSTFSQKHVRRCAAVGFSVPAFMTADPVEMALKSSEIGVLLTSTASLAKLLTTSSPLCATSLFDVLESLLTSTLSNLSTTLEAEDSWDALAILYLFETSVAAGALLHAKGTHFERFLNLTNNLREFTSQLNVAKAWSGQPAIVNILAACTSALSSLHQTLWGWTSHSPDVLLSPTTELSTSILALVSSFVSSQSVLPAPSAVTLSFCKLARSAGSCARSHWTYFAAAPLSEARREASRALAGAKGSLDKEASRICYEAITMLTMAAGFERSRNKVDQQQVANDKANFASIALHPLVNTLIESTSSVNPQNLSSLAPTIDRTSFCLSSVLNASYHLNVDSKTALKDTLSPSIQPLLHALSIFSSFSLTPSSPTTSSINNATSSLLLLLLSILTTLNKELGTDFKMLVISTLCSALSSIVPSPTPLTSSQTMVVRMLNKTLLTVFSTKNSSLAPVINAAMDLIANKIAPICQANSDNMASLLPSLLSTTYVILVSQWSTITFKEGAGEPNSPAPITVGVKVAGLPIRPPRPALFGTGGISCMKPARVKAEYAPLFDAMCTLFLFSIQADNMSPTVVAKGVKMLIKLNKKAKLFMCVDFKEKMRPTFVAAILEDLLKLNQPLLVDDMNILLFEMVSSDFDGFFKSILPSMIDSMGITNEEKISMLETWGREEDSISFRQRCESFLSEFRFYQYQSNS
ncbi:hypothetical protein TrRE_jg7673, partial [Triparma retinervis]